nr:uncharacterized protein LOC129038343 [Pongo pygmaeus]
MIRSGCGAETRAGGDALSRVARSLCPALSRRPRRLPPPTPTPGARTPARASPPPRARAAAARSSQPRGRFVPAPSPTGASPAAAPRGRAGEGRKTSEVAPPSPVASRAPFLGYRPRPRVRGVPCRPGGDLQVQPAPVSRGGSTFTEPHEYPPAAQIGSRCGGEKQYRAGRASSWASVQKVCLRGVREDQLIDDSAEAWIS